MESPTSILSPDQVEARKHFSREDLLRGLYMGRLVLVAAALLAVVFIWTSVDASQKLLSITLFVGTAAVTLASYWYTHRRRRAPSTGFLYAQVVFDVVLVTAIIHMTQGSGNDFAALYILVIALGALLLPLPGGILIAALSGFLYISDLVWMHAQPVGLGVGLQLVLFGMIALVTGWLGDRLRRAGMALGEVESELRELRLNTGDILETISTGVMSVDGQGRLVYMNKAAERLLGLELEEWLGSPVVLAVEKVAPGLGTVVRSSMKDGLARARYKAVARRNGGSITLGVSTTVFGRLGESPSVTAIFQDITDQEQLAEVSRRNERLEAVAELSASLAHEIRNPLASIRSAVEQLTGPSLEDGDRQLLKRLVINESERLSRLLSEFIDFSRLKIRKREGLDLARIVRDSIALARQHPEAIDGVEIHELGLEDVTPLMGDPDLLHRAVFNLVLNGIQFAGSGGSVTVELSRQERGLVADGVRMSAPLKLSIRDTGPGIDPQDVPRIFDPFFTRRKGGSGLGLPVVHRAVEAHHGAVFVESGDGRGAEFVIYLPVEPEAVTVEAS